MEIYKFLDPGLPSARDLVHWKSTESAEATVAFLRCNLFTEVSVPAWHSFIIAQGICLNIFSKH